MYSEDLKPYQRHLPFEIPEVLTVGWLEPEHDYPRGTVSTQIVEKIKGIIVEKTTADPIVNQMRVAHRCNFCKAEPEDISFPKSPFMGSTEIWIPGKKGKIYAAPNMIYHYIKDHNYLPPQEFLDAVMDFDLNTEFDGQALRDALVEKYYVK
jgi:hypothetical protein